MKKSFIRFLSGVLVLAILLTGSLAVLAEDLPAETQPAPESSSEPLDGSTPADESEPTDEGEPTDDGSLPADDSELPKADADDSALPDEIELPSDTAEGLWAGMPDGYTLSDAQLTEKKELERSGMPDDLSVMQPDVDYTSGIVLLAADDEEYARTVAAAYNGVLKSYADGLAEIALGAGITVQQAVTAAAADNNLPAVYVNHIARAEEQPLTTAAQEPESSIMSAYVPSRATLNTYLQFESNADPMLFPSHEYYQYHIGMMNIIPVWNMVTTGDAPITVALLDTGTDTRHEDLAGADIRLYRATDDGVVAEPGASNESFYPLGTHRASLIVGEACNKKGGAGIFDKATLMSISVTDEFGFSSTTATVIRAVNFAKENGANVICCNAEFIPYNPLLEKACNEAAAAGIPVIAPAGNTGSNAACYPARFGSVIGVAAVNRAMLRAGFSNYGAGVDVCAPGEYIGGCLNSADYASYIAISNSENASTEVAAVAALYYYSVNRYRHSALVNDLNQDGLADAKDVALLKSAMQKTGITPQSTQIGKLVNAEALICPVTDSEISIRAETKDHVEYDCKKPITIEDATLFFDYDSASTLIYTLNGKTPTAACGENYNMIYGIPLKDFKAGKLTVKAVTVNPTGTLSPVKTFTLTLRHEPTEPCLAVDIPGTEMVARGKSIPLKGEVYRTRYSRQLTKYQDISYSLDEASAAYATISSSGVLTVKKDAPLGAKISVTVKAAQKPSVTKTVVLTVVEKPLYKITPRQKTFTVSLDSFDRPINLLDLYADSKTVLSDEEKALYANSLYIKISNPKVLEMKFGGELSFVGLGTSTVTVKANDGSGKSTSFTVKVQPDTLPALDCPYYVIKGKPLKLKLDFRADTGSAAVTWSQPTAQNGVSLSKSGDFKAKYAGEYIVRATLNSDKTIYRDYTVTVLESGVDKVTVEPDYKNIVLLNPNAVCPADCALETYAQIAYSVNSTADAEYINCNYTTSNKKVVSIDGGFVIAEGPGTATVTVKADDGSGKYDTFKVTVITPVSEMAFASDTAFCVAPGRSITPKMTVGPSNATNKKLVWHIDDRSIGRGVTINASTGKITVPSNYPVDGQAMTVYAEAADGAGCRSEKMQFFVLPEATKSVTVTGDAKVLGLLSAPYPGGVLLTATSNSGVPVTWSSSNTKVAVVDGSGLVVAKGKGTATITAKARDGSGKYGTYKITVYQGAVDITVTGNETAKRTDYSVLHCGKTLQLKAKVEKGASSTAVTWKLLSAPEGVTLSSSGKLDARKCTERGTATIRVTGKHGGSAEYNVQIDNNPYQISRLLIETDERNCYETGEMDSAKTIQLFTTAPRNTAWDAPADYKENACALQAAGINTDGGYVNGDSVLYLWSTANPKVAMVDENGKLTAVSAGTTTVKCVRDDGTGKMYTTAKVVVSVPVTSITLDGGALSSRMAYGTTRTIKTYCRSELGKAAKPMDLTYTLSIDGYIGESAVHFTAADYPEAFRYISFSASTGKLKVDKRAKQALEELGFDMSDEKGITVNLDTAHPRTSLFTGKDDAHYSVLLVDAATKITPRDKTVYVTVGGDTETTRLDFLTAETAANYHLDMFQITSSNPDVVSANMYSMSTNNLGNNGMIALNLTPGKKAGSAKITVRILDGSGKYTSFYVKSTNP